jgi:hypothetical protein
MDPNDWCQSIQAVIEELGKGEQSKWHNYFDFDDSSGSRLPLEWDRANGPGRAIQELQGLPPAGDTHQHIDYYQQACRDGKEMTDIDFKGFKMYITRASDLGMLPMYDLMNHICKIWLGIYYRLLQHVWIR